MMRPARLLLIHPSPSHLTSSSNQHPAMFKPLQLNWNVILRNVSCCLLYCNSNGRKHITQLFLMTKSTTHCTPPHIIPLDTTHLIGRRLLVSSKFFSVTFSRALVFLRICCCVWKGGR